MAKTQPVNFSMYYKIEFCTNIRGHHVYQKGWTPEIGERLICLKDNRSETMEYDKHAIGVYKRVDKPDDKPKLVGHVPIECSALLVLEQLLQEKESAKSGWSCRENLHVLPKNSA